MAKKIYDEAGVDYSKVIISKEHATGAAGILINKKRSECHQCCNWGRWCFDK